MRSWVRYSVAVYLGLMIAGSLGLDRPMAIGWSDGPPTSPPPYPHEKFPSTWVSRPAPAHQLNVELLMDQDEGLGFAPSVEE